MGTQLEFWDPVSSKELHPDRIVIAVETNLHEFGERVDVMVVDEGVVRGMSHLQCDDPDVKYFNMHSKSSL